jgi:hypothetical protein
MQASSSGNTQIVRMLLADSRVDVNMQDEVGIIFLSICKFSICIRSVFALTHIALTHILRMDARPSWWHLRKAMLRL